MSHRPWTAIMMLDGHYSAIDITAPIEHADAKREIEQQNPGRKVVALIPGEHASYMHTFCTADRPTVQNKSIQHIDPFDTGYLSIDG